MDLRMARKVANMFGATST